MSARMMIARGLSVLCALGVTACATTPPPQESLLDLMRTPRQATLATCTSANMALVCRSTGFGRTAGAAALDQCDCIHRGEVALIGR